MFDEKQKIFESIPLCIKRGPYIKYQKFPETVEKVMLILKNYEKGDIQKLVQKTGFKERTMYNWLENIKKNPNFSLLSIQIRENARIFTEDEEDAIAHYILIEKINQCKLFTDEDCLEILVNAYLTKHQNDENIDYTVSFSRGYIYNFKKRHSFVSKVCHLKRRQSSNINLINSFINEMKRIFSTISFDRIINIDETALFLNAKNMKIWHSKGQDDVSVPVGFSEKKRITAIRAIGANGVKYKYSIYSKRQN